MVDQLKRLCQINKYLTVLPRSSRKQSLRQGIKGWCFIWGVWKKESEARKDAKQCKVMDFLTGWLHNEPERHTGWHECSLSRLDFSGLKRKNHSWEWSTGNRRGNLPAKQLLSFVFHLSSRLWELTLPHFWSSSHSDPEAFPPNLKWRDDWAERQLAGGVMTTMQAQFNLGSGQLREHNKVCWQGNKEECGLGDRWHNHEREGWRHVRPGLESVSYNRRYKLNQC